MFTIKLEVLTAIFKTVEEVSTLLNTKKQTARTYLDLGY